MRHGAGKYNSYEAWSKKNIFRFVICWRHDFWTKIGTSLTVLLSIPDNRRKSICMKQVMPNTHASPFTVYVLAVMNIKFYINKPFVKWVIGLLVDNNNRAAAMMEVQTIKKRVAWKWKEHRFTVLNHLSNYDYLNFILTGLAAFSTQWKRA